MRYPFRRRRGKNAIFSHIKPRNVLQITSRLIKSQMNNIFNNNYNYLQIRYVFLQDKIYKNL